MTPTDWSREIAALTPFVQGTAVELTGPARDLLAGTTPVGLGENGRSHDLGNLSDASVDTVVALGGLDTITDPFTEIQEWRRVLREDGTLALITTGDSPPTELMSLINHLGGFDLTQLRAIQTNQTWLVVGERKAIAEVRQPLGSAGPTIAARATESQAARGELYFQIGTILLQTGDSELAGKCFQSMLALEPQSIHGQFGLGMCAASQGQWATAATLLRAALARDPDNSEITRWVQLIDDRMQVEQENLAAATAAPPPPATVIQPTMPPVIEPNVQVPASPPAASNPGAGTPTTTIRGAGLRIGS